MNKQNGFSLVIVLLSVLVITAIGFTGYYVYNKQNNSKQASKESNNTEIQKEADNIEQKPIENANTPISTKIYPNNSDGTASQTFYTVELPSGWSVEKVFEPYNMVKTIENDKYLISSFIEDNSNRNLMEQRFSEGIETIKTVKTSQGTEIFVLKTPTTVFLASCVPTGDNCYLDLSGKKLYIHLYQVIEGAQSAPLIDYSADSAKNVINDFENIAKSLNI